MGEERSAYIALQKCSESRKCLAEGVGREKALSSLLIRSSIDLTHCSAQRQNSSLSKYEKYRAYILAVFMYQGFTLYSISWLLHRTGIYACASVFHRIKTSLLLGARFDHF